MDNVLQRTLPTLKRHQIRFICTEMNIERETLLAMREEELDTVYDCMCQLEIDEISSKTGRASRKGKRAAAIVTVLGNAIAESNGYLDEYNNQD